ncbi:hotdog fold thioesterase [Pleomorphovibrio marinus]|uniref:hotdog fold thioesterase n=1 Tax=Pleomorphovibrio marinus TaxID=2164132 RepID=UPI000E0BE636|nr:hotdog fold thioesterase [Pleomorphovibrio marinus]
MIFDKNLDLDFLNNLSKGSMVEHLGIEFTEVGEDYLEATMPVNEKTKQPLGLLHGGASVVLAETLGSIAGTLVVDREKAYCVGLEINANHIKSVKEGKVRGVVKPVHLGKRTQVWQIHIFNQENKLTCISRITMAVISK